MNRTVYKTEAFTRHTLGQPTCVKARNGSDALIARQDAGYDAAHRGVRFLSGSRSNQMHFYPFAQRLGIFAQRIQAGRVLAGSQCVLQPRHGGRFGTHTFGDLRLRESGGSPRGEHFVEQGKLLAFEPLVFSTYHRILEHPGYQLFMCQHA